MSGIAEQIKFIGAICGYKLGDIAHSDEETENNVTNSEVGEDAEQLSKGDMSYLHVRLFQDCLTQLYNCAQLTLGGQKISGSDPVNPNLDILTRACFFFFGCYNSYVRSLDGLSLRGYGILKSENLLIRNMEEFCQVLQQAVDMHFVPTEDQLLGEQLLAKLIEWQVDKITFEAVQLRNA